MMTNLMMKRTIITSLSLGGEGVSKNIVKLAVSPRHACGWNKKSIHEIVAPYITPSIQDFHHSSYRSTYHRCTVYILD